MQNRARLYVLLAAFCFGTTGTAQALGPDGIDPVAVGAARIVFGGALLATALWRLRTATPGGGSGLGGLGLRPGPVLVAGVAVALYQPTFFQAVADTGVAVGTIVALGSAPAIAGALELLVERRSPGRRWPFATALAVAGVVGLASAGGSGARVSATGVLLALAAGGGYAVYTLAAKRLLDAGARPDAVMGAAFGVAAVILTPVLLAVGARWVVSPEGFALAAFLAVIPTLLAYMLFARGLQRLTAGETATLTLAEPLTAAALGLLLLHEHLAPTAAVGAALVLAGLAVLAAPGRRARAQVPPREEVAA